LQDPKRRKLSLFANESVFHISTVIHPTCG
jgi:hypothetical protein